MAGSNKPEIARLKNAYKGNPTLFSFPENKTGHSILFIFKEYNYTGYTKQNNNPAYFSQRTRAGGRGLGSRTNLIQTSIGGYGSVELPFPKQLQDSTSLRINAFEREFITEAVVNQIVGRSGGAGGSIGESALSSLGGIVNSLASDLRGLGSGFMKNDKSGSESLVGQAMGAMVGTLEKAMDVDASSAKAAAAHLLRKTVGSLGGDISRTIDLVTGTTVNPKEALSFEGVDLKSHSFSWELYPSNRTETETIRKIINLFKRNALPETQDLIPGVFEQTYLLYPSTVEIKLIGTDPQHFIRYKPCMIKSVNVSYENNGTIPIIQGGVPGSVTLSVELQEMSAHTRNDVDIDGPTSREPQSSSNPPPIPDIPTGPF